MPPFLRPCLYALSAIILLIAVAVVAVNVQLQSAAMQSELRKAAMDTIGLPLTVRSTFYTPWDGIRLRGIVIPDMVNAGVNFVEASEFQIRFRLAPLLRRQFVVSSVCLKEAVVTWRQNSGGQWRIPRRALDAKPMPAGSPAAATTPAAEPAQETAAPFEVRVEQLQVLRSRMVFENRDGWPLLDADGITASASLDANGDAKGTAGIPEAVLAGLLVATGLESGFALDGGNLSFPDIRGDVSGGALSGSGRIATKQEGSPYRWSLRLDGLDMARLTLPSSFGGTRIEGRLSTDVELEGRNAPGRTVAGHGRVKIDEGRLVPSPYLQGLGEILGIREARGVNLKEATADLRLDDDLLHIEPIWLRAEEFAVELSGTVTRTGTLDLRGHLLLSPPVAARLTSLTRREIPESNRESFSGYHEVRFRVTGTLEKPSSNLASSLFGGGAGGRVGELFLNLIGAP
ncbi:MAG: hypothetical protein FGM15_00970 [Chthoniobacterales bacterium]|nr:hypothetical protein [Chthoniobacterales bacterium]